MCGIAGYYSPTSFFNVTHLPLMAGAIAHRGIDNEGFYSNATVGLAHRRLSVIDLSEQANQPMQSHCKRYLIAYNGEVYNYKEIKHKLIQTLGNDCQLTTTSDTEIILLAISTFGVNIINSFNGMFAFALYDTELNTLHIYRDKMGVKPLYYYWHEGNFAFASELKAITALQHLPKPINETAIAQFLHLGCIPAPSTIYTTVFKLQPGHCITINTTSFKVEKYITISELITKETITNEKQAHTQLNTLLTTAVQLQLQSDVPCGVFLSGGTDSSAIAAIAQATCATKINTFSIGFNEATFNEANNARQVAAYIGTQHHELIVTQANALPVIDAMQNLYDEPYADTSAIPMLFVAQFARKQVTVALSGEGADELFHGYGAYNWATRMDNKVVQSSKNVIAAALSLGNNRYKRVARLFNYKNYKRDIRSHIYSQEQYNFSAYEANKLLTYNYTNHNASKLQTNTDVPLSRTLTPAEQQAYYDLTVTLPYDLLTKVDIATMHYGLEARVPFLDDNVVQFALNLSPQLKTKNRVQKHLLKQVLYTYVPQAIMERKKQGFALPLGHWLKQDLYYLINDYLSESAVQRAGALHYAQVHAIVTQFMYTDPTLFRRVWLMIVLQKWLLTHAKS